MATDPFKNPVSGIPGSDLLNDPFKKPWPAAPPPTKSSGSGSSSGSRPKPKPSSDGNEDSSSKEPLLPETIPADAKAKKVVTLSNPKWSLEKSYFNDYAEAQVDVNLPESHKNLTRIIFTLYAQLDGKRERIDAKEAYASEGKAKVGFVLYYPPPPTGSSVSTAPYVFEALHRDSDPKESPALTVEKPETLTLDEAKEIAFSLTAQYETQGSYTKLAGNFDGAGISFGIMQWNIKWGTLQAILGKFKKANGTAFTACFEKDDKAEKKLNEVLSETQSTDEDDDTPFPKGMEWALTTHKKQSPPYDWQDKWDVYFKNLGGNTDFQTIQKQTGIQDNHKPSVSKIEWMKGICPDLWAQVWLRSYCALFDLSNQHGKASKKIRQELEKEWKKTTPQSQHEMVERLARRMAKDRAFSTQSIGRRMGILKATPNAGTDWDSVSNSLLNKVEKDKVIKGI